MIWGRLCSLTLSNADLSNEPSRFCNPVPTEPSAITILVSQIWKVHVPLYPLQLSIFCNFANNDAAKYYVVFNQQPDSLAFFVEFPSKQSN